MTLSNFIDLFRKVLWNSSIIRHKSGTSDGTISLETVILSNFRFLWNKSAIFVRIYHVHDEGQNEGPRSEQARGRK